MEQNTVLLRVQVIDMEPKTLDLRLPKFLRSSDISQRIARDAGLQAFWPDRTRKLYQIRARGRLLQANETLGDMNVVDNELIYILPQIRPNTPLQEQWPEYPVETTYAAGAISILLILLFFIMFLSTCWGLSLSESGHWTTLCLPAMGVGVLCTSFSRHAWGGRARNPKVILLAFGVFFLSLLPCFLVSLLVPTEEGFLSRMVPGMLMGGFGLMISWISWWGAVEPLNKKKQEEHKEAEQKKAENCGICGGPVDPSVMTRSTNNCRNPSCFGGVFHKGCYAASATAYRGPGGFCHVCKTKLP